MPWDPKQKPCLRPLEAFRLPEGDGAMVGVRDRSGVSDVVVSLSEPALHLMSLMDGTKTCAQIRSAFRSAYGHSVSEDTLGAMVEQLERAHLLEGPVFEDFYRAQLDDYRATGVRAMRDAAALGVTAESEEFFRGILAEAESNPRGRLAGPPRGLVAPHLDYARGRPAYAAAYATLRGRPTPDCVVILGTNHFGRSPSVVSTTSDFATPLGVTRTDVGLIERLEQECGGLRQYELDHAREHSIELQVAWLQYLFGAGSFQVAAFLCPDPCGPTGTAPYNGEGVDLSEFARALGALVDADSRDVLVVAGADLSHVGPAFGDSCSMDDAFLQSVRRRDQCALDKLLCNDVNAFINTVANQDNPTRVCSAGCLFTLRAALPHAVATLLRYHQAVDEPSQTCVTCAAVALC